MVKRRINYTRPKVTGYQRDIMDSPARFTITEASTKSGKTASHIIWLFEQALKLKENQSAWWVAPVYGQAEIAYNRMKNQVTNRSFFKANETKLRLTLPTGAHIWFKSADKPDNLYGDDVYAAVFDEFTRGKETAWHALRSTLTFTGGRCKFIGNVKGKKNWGYRLAQKARTGDDREWQHFKITAYDAVDAGILSLKEVEDARRDLPERVFSENYMAEASDDGSNPFGESHIAKCIRPISNEPPVCFGIDLGKKVDYTVITGLDRAGLVCHFDRFRKDWKQTEEVIKRLPDIPMLIDSTGNGDDIVERLQRHFQFVEGFIFNQRSKQQIMEGLAWCIQNEEIGYPEGDITNELEAFEFQYTPTGVRYSAPEGSHDDCVCSLALANKKLPDARHKGTYMFS